MNRFVINSFGVLIATSLLSTAFANQLADFDGSGHNSIFARNNTNGNSYIAKLDNNQISNTTELGTVSSLLWQVAAIADFNGDNKADLFWRNTQNGSNWLQTMNGTSVETDVPLMVVSEKWNLVGHGDMNQDGVTDVVWQHPTTGAVWFQLFDNENNNSFTPLGFVSNTQWKIIAVDDFDGDNKPDLLWRNNKTGENWLYLLDGLTQKQSLPLNTMNSSWTLAASIDLTKSGGHDLIWRNPTTGEHWLQLIKNGAISEQKAFTQIDNLNWSIAFTGDINNDTHQDIVWYNSETSKHWVYLMDGEAISASQQLDLTINSLEFKKNANQITLDSGQSLTLIDDNLWKLAFKSDGSGVAILIDGVSYGDDGNGTLIQDGTPISNTLPGDYILTIDDQTNEFTLVNASENNAPVANISPTDILEVIKGQTITFNASSSTDSDGVISGYEWSTGETTQQIEYTFNTLGEISISLYVIDDNGEKSVQPAAVNITVNEVKPNDNNQPVVEPIAISAEEDGATVTVDLVAIDADENDTHTFNVTAQPAEGRVTINNDANTLTFDPTPYFQTLAEGETTNVTFSYTATDNSFFHNATSEPQTVTVNVTGKNDRPTLRPVEIAIVEDGEPVQGAFIIVDNDANDTHHFSVTTPEEGTLTINHGERTFILDPADGFQSLAQDETQQFTLIYSATDSSETDTATSTDSEIKVTVTGVNDAPVAENLSITTDESTEETQGQVVATDIDNDSSLTYSADLSTVTEGLVSNFDINTGLFTFDPNGEFDDLILNTSRKVTFTFTATDNLEEVSNQGTVTITVEGNNAPPVVVNPLPDQRTGEEQHYSFQVPANTFEDPEAEALTISVTLANGDPITSIGLDIDNAGLISGYLNSGSAGTETIRVIATDPHGASTYTDYELTILPLIVIDDVKLQRDITGSYYEFNDPSSGNIGINMSIGLYNDDDATYQNSFGYYFVREDDFAPISGQLLQIDTRDDSGTSEEPKRFAEAISDVPDGTIGIGFFIVPDGNDTIDVIDVPNNMGGENSENSTANGYVPFAAVDFAIGSGGNYEAILRESGTIITAIGHAHTTDNGNTQLNFSDQRWNYSDATRTVLDQEIEDTDKTADDYIFGDRPGWGGGGGGDEPDVDDLYINYDLRQTSSIGTDEAEWFQGTDDADLLLAKGGNDVIVAGKGNDVIEGGAGNDLFIFKTGDHGTVADPDEKLFINFAVEPSVASPAHEPQNDIIDLSQLLVGATADTISNFISVSIKEDQLLPTGGIKEGDTTLSINVDGESGIVVELLLQRWSLDDWQTKFSDNTISDTTLIQVLIDNGYLII